MKYLIMLFMLIVPGCSWIQPSFISENSYGVASVDSGENLGGHFDEDDNWVPDNPDIPLTYKIPDISSGIIFDASDFKVTPTLQVELFEFDTHIPYVNRLVVDFGVGYQRTFIYVGKLWTSIFEITTGGFVGWDWEEKDLSYGIGATIIRF